MKRVLFIILSFVIILGITIPAAALTTVAVKGIKLNASKITLNVGATYISKATLTPANTTQKTLTYAVANKSIATVDKTGKVTGVAAGTTTVTVYTANKKIYAKLSVTVTSPYGKQLNITWVAFNHAGSYITPGSEVQKVIEQKFNVKITVPQVDIQNADSWNLFWASGNTADIIYGNYPGGYWYRTLADQSIIRPLSMDMINKYLPDWMKAINSMDNPAIVKGQMNYGGKYYFVPYDNYANTDPLLTAVRQDWLDNVGIKKLPTTLDEFHEMLLKFTKNDPDKDGKNDTFGMHGGLPYNRLNPVEGTFGLWPETYNLDSNGKVYATSACDSYKKYLELAHSWYEEGLFDPEFITDTRDIQRKKWSEGKFGVLNDDPWWFDSARSNNVIKILTDNNPKAKLSFLGPIKGPDGKAGTFVPYPNLAYNGICFGKNTSDEKVIRLMQILNTFITDKDFYVRCYYGVEGKDYTMKNGILAVNPNSSQDINIMNSRALGPVFALVPENADSYKMHELPADMQRFTFAHTLPLNYAYGETNFAFDGTNDIAKNHAQEITKIEQEYYFDAITGKQDIQSTWQGYMDELNKAGLSDVIKEYQKLYDNTKK